jgi:uncharacterized membrane protein YqiK
MHSFRKIFAQSQPDRLIALNGEAGLQADTLAPGWHWGYWPWQYGVKKEQVVVVPQGEIALSADRVGIVTTLNGLPITPGEIAGAVIEGHDNFQNVQKSLNAGGSRGLQEQILLSGSWNLNPWFVQVQQIPMTEIPIGYVGVLISYVGSVLDFLTARSDVIDFLI